jgi:Flp pilus assembly protein TadD
VVACALCGVLAWWSAHAGLPAAAVPPARSKPRKAAFATPLLVLGIAWAVLGALPVALAGHHFSAYYVTFAACGFALAAGALLAALPWPVVAVVLAAGAFGNLAANATDTFRDPATLQGRGGVSYVTFARLDWEARYLKELRRMIGVRPVERGTQIFIGNVPQALGAATAGNLAPRVWFADSTLTLDFVSKFRMRDPARPTLTLRFDRDTWKFVELPEALEAAIADGEANLLAGHIALARQQLERALELAPESTNAFERKGIANNLGMAQAMTGDTASAAVSWEIAATLDPTLREPQMNLATLEIQRHQPARARLRLDAVLAHNAADPTALWYRTLAANAMGDTASAITDFERLVKLDPHYADSVIAVARKLRR